MFVFCSFVKRVSGESANSTRAVGGPAISEALVGGSPSPGSPAGGATRVLAVVSRVSPGPRSRRRKDRSGVPRCGVGFAGDGGDRARRRRASFSALRARGPAWAEGIRRGKCFPVLGGRWPATARPRATESLGGAGAGGGIRRRAPFGRTAAREGRSASRRRFDRWPAFGRSATPAGRSGGVARLDRPAHHRWHRGLSGRRPRRRWIAATEPRGRRRRWSG